MNLRAEPAGDDEGGCRAAAYSSRVCERVEELSESVSFPSDPRVSPARQYRASRCTALWDVSIMQLLGLGRCDMIACEGEILAEPAVCRGVLVFLDALSLLSSPAQEM